MLLYDCTTAPSPRRVRIFAAEKGIDLPMQQVDLRNKEQLGDAYRAINSRCDVPYLVLDDGTGIGEVEAICRYLEAEFPETLLFGSTPKEIGLVSMWNHRVEMEGLMAVAETFRNSSPAFKDRALAGPANRAQIPELAERGRAKLELFMVNLDKQLSENAFVAGENFSFADISAMVAVEFAGWVKVTPADDHINLKKWHEAVSSRPSSKA